MRLFVALCAWLMAQGLLAQELPKGAASSAAPMISSGEFHSLAVDKNGKVYSWGSDFNGQLGLGRKLVRPTPVQIRGLPPITSFSTQANYVLAIDSSRRVWAWGYNACGRLGPRDEVSESTPAPIRGLDNIVMVATAACFSLALRADGTVWGWGWVPGYGRDRALRKLSGLAGIVEISAGGVGYGVALARRGDGKVIYLGNEGPALDAGPRELGLSNATAIAVGSDSSVAVLLQSGAIHAFGFAAGTANLASAIRVLRDVGAPVSSISISGRIYAIRGDGTAVGYDQDANAWTTTDAASFNDLRSFAGFSWFVGVQRSGRLLASGANDFGQLGQGDTTSRSGVLPVPGFERTLSAYWGRSLFALKADGTLWIWGEDTRGQGGDGSVVHTNFPQEVPIAAFIVSACATWYDSWALDSTGNVWRWGTGFLQSTPQMVPGRTGVKELACGRGGVAYLTSRGTVQHDGNVVASRNGLGDLDGFVDITSIAVSSVAIYGLTSAGRVHAVGRNSCGELGDGTTTARTTAIPVQGILGTATRVSAAGNRAGALTSDGKAWTWGGYNCFQPPASLVATATAGVSDAILLSVADRGELLALRDGSVLVRDLVSLSWIDTYTHASGLSAIRFDDGPPQSLTAGYGPGSMYFLVGKSGIAWGLGHPSLSAFLTVGEFASLGDGVYVDRRKPVVLRAPSGRGSLDRNDWFLDLDASKPDTVPSVAIPTALALAEAFSDYAALGLQARMQYRASEVGKAVNIYVMGLVPPAFFTLVKTAPGLSPPVELAKRAKATNGLVFALLTPAGWIDASGQLSAFMQGTANAAGSLARILNGVPINQAPGARFCIGYGDSTSSLISAQSVAEVLRVEGATTEVEGIPCLLSGLYLEGPRSSIAGSSATFTASVVGIAPSGTVQFKDGAANLQGPRTLAATSGASAKASVSTASLAVGTHSIGAAWSGDATLAPQPLQHEVAAAPPGTSSTRLAGPVKSVLGEEAVFSVTVTGANPSGNVQLRVANAPHGDAAPVVNGLATFRINTLPLGTLSLTAAYSGDSGNAASVSPVLGHLVLQVTSAGVTLSSSASPAFLGTAATFTAVVTGDSPTGQVVFRDSRAALGSVSLANGSASLTISTLSAGLHIITAEYSGDSRNATTVSGTLAYLVDLGAKLTVAAGGAGFGRVVSSPQGISCGPNCAANFTPGTAVGLNAAPAFGSSFAGWGGACSGQGACTVTMSADASVSATFTAVAGGSLTASTRALDFGGQSMMTTSPAQVVTLTNASSATITVTSIAASANFSVAHACATLAPGAGCTISVTFVPVQEGRITGYLTTQSSIGTYTLGLDGIGERSLVTHYYRSILRRAPDAGGKQFWETEAARVQGLGANVNETWYAMVMSFFASPEYLALNRSPSEFVRDLYSTFFNRAADEAGLTYWTGQLSAGLSREMVLTGFMFSPEFRGFAEAIFGSTAARAEVDMVVDFYRGLLGRLPDSAGFAYWLSVFRTAQCQGAPAVYSQVEAISSAYMNSMEYVGRGRDSVQFVSDLYNTFLRRGGDVGGVRFWVGELDARTRTREDVRRQFIASPEFSARVQAVITQGCGS